MPPPPPPPFLPPPPPPPSKSETLMNSLLECTSRFGRMLIHASKAHEGITRFAAQENERTSRSRALRDSLCQDQELQTEIQQIDPKESDSTFLALYSHVQPILQNGPLCGLVALAMTESLLIPPKDLMELDVFKVDPDRILEEAVKSGFTRKGEIFSAQSMLELARKFFPQLTVEIIDTSEENAIGGIRDNLIDGNSILIPYDADFNHGPALRNGHAAHWALLHGIAIRIPNSSPRTDSVSDTTMNNLQLQLQKFLDDHQLHKSNLSTLLERCYCTSEPIQAATNTPIILDHLTITQVAKDKLKELLSENEKTDLSQFCAYAIGHQGKSAHVGIWDLETLIKSNQNLHQVSPKIMEMQEQDPYILGDIANSLRSKVVVMKRKKEGI